MLNPILTSALLLPVLAQSGWTLVPAPPREVHMTYWELVPETEVWVRLVPERTEGPPLVNLVFHAFFPGRAAKDQYSGKVRWPTGPPTRITVSAEPSPLTVIRELSLLMSIDGRTIDLTAPDSRYRNLPCLIAMDGCMPNAVEADLDPEVLRALATARSVDVRALGFPSRLAAADRAALATFLKKVGLAEVTPAR